MPVCGCLEVNEGEAIFIHPLEKVKRSKQIDFHQTLIVSSYLCITPLSCILLRSSNVHTPMVVRNANGFRKHTARSDWPMAEPDFSPFLKDAGKQLELSPTRDQHFWQVKLYQRKHAEMKTNTSWLANYACIGVSAPHHCEVSAGPASWPTSSETWDNLAVHATRFWLDIARLTRQWPVCDFSNPLFHIPSYELLDWHQAGISQAMWPELTPNPAPLILLIAWAQPTLFIGP